MHRIIFVIAVFLFSLSSVMGQMIPVNLPADGNWPTIVGDSIMIIGPRQDELTEEQRYFNPVYLMVYPGKEHLAAQIIRAGLCDCDLTKPNRRIGVFSVAPNKQVSFSQGNLQYLPAINLWKFANTQYEYLGNANKYLKPTFRNWVDLFGWSANNTTAPFGVSISTNVADYAGDFVDWGTNTICGDAPGTWRTLSNAEWEYVLNGRDNAEQLRTKGSVEGKEGVILLPDNWICPEGYTIAIIPDEANLQSNVNTYSQADWSKLEDAGAIILPSAGMRRNATELEVRYLNIFGGYWTCTNKDEHNSYCYTFHTQDCEYMDYSEHIYGRSVRLVHDTIVPETTPAPCLIVKVNDTLSINMMCVEGGTFTMGDDNTSNASPAHQVTLSDYYIGQTEVTQALWKAVMGDIPTGNKNPSYPVGYVSYADCQNFIAKLNNLTGLYFQLPTEAEWEYAAMGGNRSHGYIYSGSNTIDDVAWYDQNSENKLHHVGAKQPNELGIYDMSGNAWEWCADYHGKYTAENQINPQGPATGTDRVIRSGSFRTTADRCTNKHRQAREADYPDSHITLRLVLHDTVPEPPKRIGVFSVAADKQVSFSQGNLQYIQSTDTWQFANNQLEYMGHKHYRNGQLADTIEYFGWSGKDSKAPWGISLSTESSDYEGEFLDWGTNTIAGSAPNTWRTLSNDEWLYICQGRKNADQLLGLGKISSIFGLIILPDDWVAPEGITFTPNDNNPNTNVYSLQQWTAMEEAGAIFIPPTGYFNHDIDNMRYVGTYGYARNNTLTANGLQIYTLFKPSEIQYSRSAQGNNGNLYYAFPQRLVHDTIVPKPEPEYVDLGLSVKWATFNVGASKPEDYGDYFAWGETEPKETYSWATYKWCDGTSTNMTKYNTEDGKTILEPADDAAQVHWGGKWRMPSKEEVDELTQQCNWIWTTHNNVNGYKVTGPNGNSIFLPAAGYKGAGPTYPAGEDGLYWTSTLEKGHYSYLIVLHNDAPPTEASTKGTRCFGFTIRPVYDDVPDPCLVVKVNDTLSINMMCVEGGTFIMGAGANEHQVTLSDYTIGQTEVTQELWEAVMGTNPNANTANKQLPVTNISWYDCQAFINKLNQQTGLRFRLPTEAEWEYAARGGEKSKGYEYAGSDMIGDVAWYKGNSNNAIHTVAKKLPNELGIYDMSGNVWEWCEDYYDTDETMHVVKSGSFYDLASTCRIDFRTARLADYKSYIGLRLVLDERSITPEPEYVDLGLSVK